MSEDNITLTDAQKQFIDSNWESMDLKTLTQKVFNNPALDGRTLQAKAVKGHVASKGEIKTTEYKKMGPLELTKEQKEYIENNFQSASGPLEIAKTLFNKEKLSTLDRETRAVIQHWKLIDPNYRKDEDPVEELEYKAPTSISQAVKKINASTGKAYIDPDKLTAMDNKDMTALIRYLNIPRFKIEANKYTKKIDRELFESTFIAFCHDKSDLLEEEIHQYIALASEIVVTHQVDRTIQKLDERVEYMLSDPSAKFDANTVEMINAAREKSDKSKERQKKLYNELIQARSKRLDNQIQSSASMHNLVQAWATDVEKRKKMISSANVYKDKLGKEIDRLSDMDSLKAEIYGLSRENILR